MVLDAVSNFVRGTADAEVGTDDTTVSVDDASIFPDPATDGEFNVVIWDANSFPRPDQDGNVEILRVTERDTDANELTVTRGQELTSAAAHPEGSAIHLSPTAKMFSDIESTFGDFWNPESGENGQLTADVNNTNTTTQALEAESVSTERASIESGELPFGDWSADPEEPSFISWEGFGIAAVQIPDFTADNTARDLIDVGYEELSIREGRLLCSLQDGSDIRTDLVIFTNRDTFSTADTVTRGSPADTSYSNDSDMIELAIDGGGSDYNVVATIIGGNI